MTHTIAIQHAIKNGFIPENSLMRKWARAVLDDRNISAASMTIRIVEVAEIAKLNHTYRFKSGGTNVLSFPFEGPKDIQDDVAYLGDIVICADIVNREAVEQDKTAEAHWAHMIIHGLYHLLGYDHQDDAQANKMEALESKSLEELGFNNPYKTGEQFESHD